MDRADVSASVTPRDEDNLVSCQLARLSFGVDAVVLLRDSNGEPRVAGSSNPGVHLSAGETAAARWVGDHGRPAGRGTDTYADVPVVCVPIATGESVLGVLALRSAGRVPSDAEQRGFLEAFVRQIARTMERVRLSGEARAAALRARTEEIRTSLLSAVSHDLRTPLAAIIGAGSALGMDPGRLGIERHKELLDTICDEAGRMDRLIGNILDMVRLEAGGAGGETRMGSPRGAGRPGPGTAGRPARRARGAARPAG